VTPTIRSGPLPAQPLARGVRVWIYRRADGHTDNPEGLSSLSQRATITAVIPIDPLRGARALQPLPVSGGHVPDSAAPALWLARSTLPGHRDAYLVPADLPLIDGVPLLQAVRFGGNFAFSPEPAYSRLLGWSGALPIHDDNPGGAA
jgi:hypothetical protein